MFLKLSPNIVGKLSPNIAIYRLVGTELKSTFFKEHLWATASTLREGRRLMQIEISIFFKLHKENNKKIKMFLHFQFFTYCAHPFSFRASLFIKRPYVSLYSYFHYVQTC